MTHLPYRLLLPDRFSFGPWQVNLSLDEVRIHNQAHKLEPRAMRLLAVLAQARGDVVLADDLMSTVWPGLVVTPSSLYDAVAQLRKVLGPDHIATVPSKGYRLVTPVGTVMPVVAQASTGPDAPTDGPCLGSRSAVALASQEWVSNLLRAMTTEALRAIGAPEPRQVTECESFSAMHSLLASSDMLAVVRHPFLAMPQVAEALQQIHVEERLPGITVGLHTRADAPFTRPAAALARLLSEIGRRVLQKPSQ